MLFLILLIAQIIICAAMGGLILIQRSEGGALGMGGGPTGFMSARGTGNLLTTATAWFALLFFANSIAMTVVGNLQNHVTSAVDKVDTSNLQLNPTAAAQQEAAQAAAASSSSASISLPLSGLPLAGSTPAAQAPAPTVIAPAPSSAAPAASHQAPAAPAKLPAKLPAKFPASSASASSPTADQIAKAKASVFHTQAPSASSAPPASTASAPAAPAGSSSTTPQ